MTPKPPSPRVHGLSRYKHGPDEHGTEGKGCRCTVCIQAGSTYDRHRARQIAYKRWEPYIPADRARVHARWLMSRGMSWHRIAREAGMSTGGMSRLLYGAKGSRPTRRIRPSVEAAILAVRPPAVQGYGGARQDATGTIRRIQGLARGGWTLRELSARLGQYDAGRILRQASVTPATAAAVKTLAGKLETQAPPAGTMFARRAVTAARGRAEREGWVLLAAWDDDPGPHCIDDPDATPAAGWQRGRRVRGDVFADVAELGALEVIPEVIAARVGVSEETVRSYLKRARHAGAEGGRQQGTEAA